MSQLFIFPDFKPALEKVARRNSEPKRIKEIMQERLDSLSPNTTFIHKGKVYSFQKKQGFICFALTSKGEQIYLQGQNLCNCNERGCKMTLLLTHKEYWFLEVACRYFNKQSYSHNASIENDGLTKNGFISCWINDYPDNQLSIIEIMLRIREKKGGKNV